MRIEIPMKQWGRGKTGGSFCTVTDGVACYCAMGFVLKALGFSDEDLKDIASLSELPLDDVRTKVPPALYYEMDFAHGIMPSDVTLRVTDTNDNTAMTDDDRQRRLALYLEPYGFDLTFQE